MISIMNLFFLFFLSMTVPRMAAAGGDGVLKLETSKTHLQIFADSALPALTFRRKDQPKGKADIELNAEGLFVNGAKVCGWPGGRFDSNQSANMVLGYSSLAFRTAGKYEYKACPSDVPVKSTWGDGGTGAAALYVEVEQVSKDQAVMEFRGTPLYLDLKAIKGKYQVLAPGSLSNKPGD
jgi:hypothetical protein